jgi:hypothetical protein
MQSLDQLKPGSTESVGSLIPRVHAWTPSGGWATSVGAIGGHRYEYKYCGALLSEIAGGGDAFGTNWSVYSNKAGPIIGPLMAYEVLTAFFLEAGFLGVMLFGMAKVGKSLHFFATCMVALGTLVSATWIISANSWMQTPVGFAMNAKGQFVPAGSWWPIFFNPSFPYRLIHTVIASYLTTALVVGGVGAWNLLKDRTNPHARVMFSMAMWTLAGLKDFPTDRWPPVPSLEPRRETLRPDSARWRKVAGVEPTGKRLTSPTGFEVRPHHRMRMPSEFADDARYNAGFSPHRANCCRHAAPAHRACGEYSQRGRRTPKSESRACAQRRWHRDSEPRARHRVDPRVP